jgi:DNA-directed RNA polymerase subunit RPC12/RpoP
MAWLVRYKCHQCGAVREPGDDSGWVRCAHCSMLIAFDWQAWLASPAYRQYLSDSLSGTTQAGWASYQTLLNEGDALHASGESIKAAEKFEQAVGLTFDMLPGIYPKEVPRAPALNFSAAFLSLQRMNDAVRKLNEDMLSLLKSLDFRNPLPTVLACVQLLEQQFNLALRIGLPPDPDSMPMGARLQVLKSQFVGGYASMMSAENRLELLQHVYGRDAVTEVADGQFDDGLGLFRDWACPMCGLWSVQSRHAHEFTCMACFFRKPVSPSDDPLPKIQALCGTCSAEMTLENGQTEGACVYCHSWVRRVRHDRSNEIDFQVEMRAHIQAAVMSKTGHTLVFESLPVEGKLGLEVTSQNRHSLKLQGFVRLIAAYQSFVPAARFTRLLQRSFSIVSGVETAACIQRVAEQARIDRQFEATQATLASMTSLV